MTEPEPNWTVIVEPEGDGFVGHCPMFDIASQGATYEETIANVHEAVAMFLEVSDPAEIARRWQGVLDE